MTVALMPGMCEREGTASVSMDWNVSKAEREEVSAGTWRIRPRQGSQRTLRCSVKPSVPPMATSPSPSSSRPRFLDKPPNEDRDVNMVGDDHVVECN